MHHLFKYMSIILVKPLFFLSLFCAAGSAIWLATLDEWVGIGYGVVMMVFVYPIYLVCILVAAVSTSRIINIFESVMARKTFSIIHILSVLVTDVIFIFGWAVFVFTVFIQRSDFDSLEPYLLWSYAVATGPWAFMSFRDDEEPFLAVPGFFLQTACAVLALSVGFFDVLLATAVWFFAGIACFGFLMWAPLETEKELVKYGIS